MKNKKNYLDYIPQKNEAFRWEVSDGGHVIIYRENTKVMERITQFLLKTPKVTRIELEQYGDFIWPLIDGERTVYEIAQLVQETFGEQAEPLYERLVAYFRSMYANKLITMKNE